jgi:competence protein ComEC
VPAVVWCAFGFVAGDLAGLLCVGASWALAPALAAAALGAWRRHGGWAVALTAAAAGAIWGGAAGIRASRDCRARWREGERVAVVVEAWDAVSARGASRVTVRWPARCAGPLTVVWPVWTRSGAGVAVVVGTWHRAAARVATAWPGRPARAGRLVAVRVRPLAARAGWRERFRVAAERRIGTLFEPDRASLAAALTVGSGDQLEAEVRRRFARAGMAHLLAISGLHVGLLAGAMMLALRAAGLGAMPARVAGTGLAAAYVWLLGLPAPAVRAVGLIALWCLALVRQRPPVPHAALAAAALAVVALDPLAVVDAGPWLSFAGAWGCVRAVRLWAALRGEGAVPREGRVAALVAAGVVAAGATLATAPVSILAFGTMSPAALVANLVAIPVAGLVMPALALTLLVAALLPGAAWLPAGAAALGLDALGRIAAAAGALPLATVGFERRVAAAVVVAAVGWLVLSTPGGGPGRRTRSLLGARATVAAALALAAAAWWPRLSEPASGDRAGWLTLHFLAVGQGDAAVAHTPGGRWIVIDGGPRTVGFDAGASVVVPFLRAHGARRVAAVVASHADADHLGGLPAVIRALRPELVLEPGEPRAGRLYRGFLAALARAGSRWHPARAGDSLVLDGVVLRVRHPDSAWLARGLPLNENSVVATLELGAFGALFTGDAGVALEAAALSPGAVPRVTVLKVSHHGSRAATGARFLAAAAPEVCVISAGPNHYGLPDPVVLDALARAGCAVFRTDRDGAVTVETDGRTVRVRAGRRDTTFLSTRGQR